jgi:hypothetical protein
MTDASKQPETERCANIWNSQKPNKNKKHSHKKIFPRTSEESYGRFAARDCGWAD